MINKQVKVQIGFSKQHQIVDLVGIHMQPTMYADQ